MKHLTASHVRKSLYRLLYEVAESCEPIRIAGPRTAAVLVSEAHWRAIQETLCLLSVPGMRVSVRKGLATPDDECAEEPGW
jgi:PHD/YefM family antitoxin component YafN of YafNO toxin-antitoxin module